MTICPFRLPQLVIRSLAITSNNITSPITCKHNTTTTAHTRVTSLILAYKLTSKSTKRSPLMLPTPHTLNTRNSRWRNTHKPSSSNSSSSSSNNLPKLMFHLLIRMLLSTSSINRLNSRSNNKPSNRRSR